MLSKRGDFLQDFIKPLSALGRNCFLGKNKTGDTRLHELIKEKAPPEVIEAYLSQVSSLNKRAALGLAHTVNREGMLPINLLPPNHKSPQEQEICSILLSHMIPLKVKPLSEKLDRASMLEIFKGQLSPQLIKNFDLAFSVAIKTRKALHHSYTHPDVNLFSASKKTALISKIDAMRELANSISAKISKSDPELNKKALSKLTLEQVALLYIKNGVGNCEEYSQLALYFALKADPKINAEIFGCGDHAFIVFDRDPKSNLNDLDTWGSDALICDPWKGLIYPVSAWRDLLFEIRTCYINGVDYEFNVKFNPEVHALELRCAFQEFSPALAQEEIKPTVKP